MLKARARRITCQEEVEEEVEVEEEEKKDETGKGKGRPRGGGKHQNFFCDINFICFTNFLNKIYFLIIYIFKIIERKIYVGEKVFKQFVFSNNLYLTKVRYRYFS